jgi:hypothetical protein
MGDPDIAGAWRRTGGGTAFIITGGVTRVGEVTTVGEMAVAVVAVEPGSSMRGKEITRWMEGMGWIG